MIAGDPKTSVEFLTRKQAADYLRALGLPISVGTLANLGARDNAGRGPPFSRFRTRGTVRYRRDELDIWAQQEIRRVE